MSLDVLKNKYAEQLITSLDEVLEFIVTRPSAGVRLTYEELLANFPSHIDLQMQSHIEKLLQDDLIYYDKIETPVKGHTEIIIAKHDGIIKYLTGGYEGEIKRIKDNKNLEASLKKVSISSMNLSKRIGLYALGIAVLGAIVPFIIYFIGRNDTVQVDTKTKEVTHLLEVLEDNRKQEKSFQDSVVKYLKIRQTINQP